MEFVIAGLALIAVLVSVVNLVKLSKLNGGGGDDEAMRRVLENQRSQSESIARLSQDINSATQTSITNLGTILESAQKERQEKANAELSAALGRMNERVNSMDLHMEALVRDVGDQLTAIREGTEKQFAAVREGVDKQLSAIREEMNKQLNAVRTELDKQLSETRGLMDRQLSSIRETTETKLGEGRDASVRAITDRSDTTEKNLQTKLDGMKEQITQFTAENEKRLQAMRNEVESKLQQIRETTEKKLDDGQKGSERVLTNLSQTTDRNLKTNLDAVKEQIAQFTANNEQRMNEMRETMERQLDRIRRDNSEKLEEMRRTVDEKLQKELEERVRESFKAVGEKLDSVQQGLGRMSTLAEDVGGLKKTLSNVKTRGMMGELQLENILQNVFAQDQYIKDANPVPDNKNLVVEFALKIPTKDGDHILLPIDSKFPRERYEAVVEASENGDKAALDAAIKAYVTELRREAGEIKKYIAPPHTTDFALMFLPTESMYAEAVNRGMLEQLMREYKVYITGPSTIGALMSSLQLAFNNFAIQQRAGEVYKVLKEVQSEFGKFESGLGKLQTHLDQAGKDLNDLMGTRTRQMTRKLNGIDALQIQGQTVDALPALIGENND